MTAKKKITDKNGVQVFPVTHTRAVIDDNGNSVEQRLDEQMDVINQKQLEVGAVPSDVTPTAGSTNWVTSGGVYDSTVKEIKKIKGDFFSVNFTDYEATDMIIPSGDNPSWAVSSAGVQTRFIPLDGIGKISLTAATITINYALLSSDSHIDGELVSFAGGRTARRELSAYSGVTTLNVPEDAVCLYIVTKTSQYSALSRGLALEMAYKSPFLKKEEKDTYPTVGSGNYVQSGGIATLVGKMIGYQPELTVGAIDRTDGSTGNSHYRTPYIEINDGESIFAYCYNTASIAGVALYSENNVASFVGASPEGSNTLFISAEYIAQLGAKYFRCSVHRDQMANGNWFVCKSSIASLTDKANTLESAINTLNLHTKRMVASNNTSYVVENGEVTVTIDFLQVWKAGVKEPVNYYADGDATTHSPKSFLLNKSNRFLVLTSAGEIVIRTENSKVASQDIILLCMYKKAVIGGELFCDFIYKTGNSNETGENKDVPENIGVYNAILKAAQMTQLVWTPKGVIPKNNGEYSADVERKGMIYSSVKEYNQYVMTDVSLETFMTAINNPRSVLYTENIRETSSQSALGRVYHGSNCAAYYGNVCSTLVSYAIGLKYPMTTTEMWSWDELEKIEDQSAYGVKLCDILLTDGHTRMITSITRNNKGIVTSIRVSEMVQNGGRGINYTAEQFNEQLGEDAANNEYTIFRYKKLYSNRSYTPHNEFVAVDDEELIGYEYNDDICPNYGNKANYVEGDVIVLNLRTDYASAGFTSVELYKNDVLFRTINIQSEDVDLTNINLGYGDYKARAVGTETSEFCEFKVVDAVVTRNGDSFNFSATNAQPLYYEFVNQSGSKSHAIVGVAVREFTEAEILDGAATPYGDVVARESYPYLKVHFGNEYGRVIKKILW